VKKILCAAALIMAATTTGAFAQLGDYGSSGYPGYGRESGYGGGYYNYSPGYGRGNFHRHQSYYGNPSRDDERGGPGPRVGAGSGTGVGSQR